MHIRFADFQTIETEAPCGFFGKDDELINQIYQQFRVEIINGKRYYFLKDIIDKANRIKDEELLVKEDELRDEAETNWQDEKEEQYI